MQSIMSFSLGHTSTLTAKDLKTDIQGHNESVSISMPIVFEFIIVPN